MSECKKPEPTYDPERNLFICKDCGVALSLCEYESNGTRMRWWRHVRGPERRAGGVLVSVK